MPVMATRRPRYLGMNGKKAGAGRGFENEVARCDRRGVRCDEGQRQGRGELLHGLTLVGAPCVGRNEFRDALHHRQRCLRRGGPGQDRRAEPAQKQHLGDFERLIGVLPDPEPLRIAAAKTCHHEGAQCGGGDRLALL
ncbi:hypothetical protein [Mesorhizobium sp. M0859]|uniref:hypothetical protein n=1 Tax=Mesorhizobium sp. M0859 TaxID=2957014 RepID=UPI0033364227